MCLNLFNALIASQNTVSAFKADASPESGRGKYTGNGMRRMLGDGGSIEFDTSREALRSVGTADGVTEAARGDGDVDWR